MFAIKKMQIIVFILCCYQIIFAVEYLKSRDDIPGLTNFAKVSNNLYRGAQPEKQGFAELKKMGIKTIVNLRANHSDEKAIKGLGFQYYSIPIDTWNLEDEHVVRFLKIVKNPNNSPVFVHCQHGSDRTGTMIASYRMYVEGWSNKDAEEEIKNFKFNEIWKNLRKYIRDFDTTKIKEKMGKFTNSKLIIVK